MSEDKHARVGRWYTAHLQDAIHLKHMCVAVTGAMHCVHLGYVELVRTWTFSLRRKEPLETFEQRNKAI